MPILQVIEPFGRSLRVSWAGPWPLCDPGRRSPRRSRGKWALADHAHSAGRPAPPRDGRDRRLRAARTSGPPGRVPPPMRTEPEAGLAVPTRLAEIAEVELTRADQAMRQNQEIGRAHV